MIMSEPVQDAYREKMQAISEVLDKTFNDNRPDDMNKIVFSLFVAESGKMDGGRVNYMSNGNRNDMTSMVKEWLARTEGALGVTASQKVQ